MHIAMQLYLIRHGQSTNNVSMARDPDDRVVDAPLTELGWEQARRAAQHLATTRNIDSAVEQHYGFPSPTPQVGAGFTHIYCSPMHRTLQTARPIADAFGLKPQVWVETHEHGGQHLRIDGVVRGFPGKTRAEVAEEFPDYGLPVELTDAGWWRVEDGEEDIYGCFTRAMRVANKLHDRAATLRNRGEVESLALVTHGTFMDALLKALFNQLPASPANTAYYTHYNTGITRLDFMPTGVPKIRYLNRVDHLTPELVS